MIGTLKSDFRKLSTIRSTYFISIIAIGFIGALSFWFEGIKANSEQLSNTTLQSVISSSVSVGAIAVSIITILLMAHEYRYNTISYTLTAAANRSKVLASKAITVIIFSAIFGLVLTAVAIASCLLGLSISGESLPGQNLDIASVIMKVVLYFAGYALASLWIAVILRSLVGAIVCFFIIPSTIESLLGALILKDNAKYLPFRSLDGILTFQSSPSYLTPTDSAFVAGLYLLAFGVVAWLLFTRRDAS